MLPDDPFGLPRLDPRDAPAMSLLGHDLRAALAEVIGGLRLIDTAQLPGTTRAQIARSKAAGEALALLLEQALALLLDDLNGVEDPAPVLQTDRLIESTRLRWSERMRAAGLELDITACPNLPRQIGVDAALLERVLSNLLGNAVKYAGTGIVRCELSAPSGRWLQIVIADQGPGFSQEVQRTLFSSFGMGRNSGKPGSGLGLMIVHEMVLRAGGSIVAHNRPEGGAEVIVRLLLAKVDTAGLDDLQPLLSGSLASLRVLVADDNATSRLLHGRLLTDMGAEVVTVADGAQAIGRIEREHFDLAVIDIEMPQMNGLDVIRHIRAMAGPTKDLPVLAVTAYRLRANRTAIDAAGADGIVSKPVPSAASLHDSVLAAMDRRAGSAQSGADEADEKVVPLQFARLMKMAGPEIAAEMLAGFQSDLRKIERGLLAASHGPDWDQVARQSHNLIAIAGTAGAEKLRELATQMNTLAHDLAPDLGTFLTLLPQVLESLDALIEFIGDYAQDSGGLP